MPGNIDDVLQAGVEKSIDEGWLLDVTDAIRIRFKKEEQTIFTDSLLNG